MTIFLLVLVIASLLIRCNGLISIFVFGSNLVLPFAAKFLFCLPKIIKIFSLYSGCLLNYDCRAFLVRTNRSNSLPLVTSLACYLAS